MYDEISIWDILSLLRLGEPKYGSSSFNVACPCCDEGRDKHLNINVVKEVFRCPKCGISGGKLKLYSVFMNVPMSQVGASIRDRMGIESAVDKPLRRPVLFQTVQTEREYPITDVETRHPSFLSVLDIQRNLRFSTLSKRICKPCILPSSSLTGISIPRLSFANVHSSFSFL